MQELLAIIVLSWATSAFPISTAINNSTLKENQLPQTGITAIQISDVITVPGQEEVCIPFNITQPSIVTLNFNCSDLSNKITSTIDVKFFSIDEPNNGNLTWDSLAFGNISIEAPPYSFGKYFFCFSGLKSPWFMWRKVSYEICIDTPAQPENTANGTRKTFVQKFLLFIARYFESFPLVQKFLTDEKLTKGFITAVVSIVVLYVLWMKVPWRKPMKLLSFCIEWIKYRGKKRRPPETALPPELVERIFASLEPGDLLVSRLVSKTWRNFVDNSPLWKWKYMQTFGQSLNLDLDERFGWRQLFFYRLVAEKNMSNTRPRFVVTDLYGHNAKVTCVTSYNNTIVSADENNTIRIWDMCDEKLLQVLDCPIPVQQLLVSKDCKHIIAYGQRGKNGKGMLMVWTYVPTSQKWIANWSRTMWVKDDVQMRVQKVTYLTVCELPSGPCIVTARRDSPLLEFWSLEHKGKHVTTIQSACETIWGISPFLDGAYFIIVGDLVCEIHVFNRTLNRYELGPNRRMKLTQADIPTVIGTSNWSCKIKTNDIKAQVMLALYSYKENEGTEFILCRFAFPMHDIKSVDRFSAKVQSKIHFIDFNNSLIVTGREGNDTVYSANFNRWQSGWFLPTLVNASAVGCIYADGDKIISGCAEPPYAVHVWDYACKERSPKDHFDFQLTKKAAWMMWTNVHRLRVEALCPRPLVNQIRKAMGSAISVFPYFALSLGNMYWEGMIASVILCIVLSTSLRKNEWVRVFSSVGLGWVMNLLLLVKKQSPWHYTPILWSTILSSGVEYAMQHAAPSRAFKGPVSSYNAFLTFTLLLAFNSNNASPLGGLFLYDWWFFVFTSASRILLHMNYNPMELAVWIIFPYLSMITSIGLMVGSFLCYLVADAGFYASLPSLFTKTNVFLRFHMSLWGFFSNSIAVSIARTNPTNFVLKGGWLYVFAILQLWILML